VEEKLISCYYLQVTEKIWKSIYNESVIVSLLAFCPSPIKGNIVVHKILRRRQSAEIKPVTLIHKGKKGEFFT
jgi:hypothetical protein